MWSDFSREFSIQNSQNYYKKEIYSLFLYLYFIACIRIRFVSFRAFANPSQNTEQKQISGLNEIQIQKL